MNVAIGNGPRWRAQTLTNGIVTIVVTMALIAWSPCLEAAPLIEVTAEVFAKVPAMAQQAREKHAAWPTDAAREFNDLFEADLGDVMPNEAVIPLTDGIGDSIEYALLNDEPIPETPV